MVAELQEGYNDLRGDNATGACARWLPAWNTLQKHLPPSVNSTKEAQKQLGSQTPLLFNWVQDCSRNLLNAAVQDTTYADRGARFIEEVLERFPDEGELFRRNMAADRGELLARAGRTDVAADIFHERINEQPRKARGYVRWSDALVAQDPPDFAEAIDLLERALNGPVLDPEDCSLKLRLEDLKSDAETLGENTQKAE